MILTQGKLNTEKKVKCLIFFPTGDETILEIHYITVHLQFFGIL